ARLLLPSNPSASYAEYSCRVAFQAHSRRDGVCDAYIASGRQVYHCQMPIGQESLLQQGKAQVLLPHPVEVGFVD
ncbi:unnamed protein product, partial [Closterium sp. NIES-53]